MSKSKLIKQGKISLVVSLVVSTLVWSLGFTALTMNVTAATAGDLIKQAGSASVYYLGTDNKRYVFPNQSVFQSWYGNNATVTTVSSDTLLAYELGGNVLGRSGRLIQVVTNDTPWKVASSSVYALTTSGTIQAIDSAATASALFGSNWESKIIPLPESLFTNYKAGTALNSSSKIPDGFLVKTASSSDTFIIDGGQKRVVSAEGFTANNFKNSDIATVVSLSSYGDGSAVSAKEAGLGTIGSGSGTSVISGGLTVAISSSNPATATIASNTAFNEVLKLSLTAGSTGDAKITGITVKKAGLSGNTIVTGVDVIDGSGNRHGNVISSIADDNTATITFANDPIVVTAGSTNSLTIRFNNTGTTGTIQFGITSAAAIETTSVITGTFPIWGNIMGLASGSASIATATFDARPVNASGTSLNVDAAASQEIAKFNIAETSSNEDMELRTLTLYNNGNASDTDYKDVELLDPALNVLASAQPKGNYTTFNLATPYRIAKGLNKTLSVRTKIVNGATRTIQFTAYNNYDVVVRGLSSGANVLPAAGSTDTSFPIGDATNYNKVTIASGTVTLNKASDSNSSAVAAGDTSIELAKFSIKPQGEDMELRAISAGIDTAGANTALTGSVYVKYNGATIWSGAASTTSLVSTTGAVTALSLSSYPIMKAGSTGYITVEGSVSSSAATTDIYTVFLDVTQVKRLITNDLTDPAVAVAQANSISVKAVAVTVTTLSQPVATSVVVGANDVELARIDLDASSSGEDVKVSSLVVQDSLVSVTTPWSSFADINNLRLYVSGQTEALNTSTNTNSITGTDPTTATTTLGTVTFTFSSPITVKRSAVTHLVLKGTIAAKDDAGAETHTFSIANTASNVTATGTGTGNSISAPTISGSGQAMTIASAGALIMTLDTSSTGSPTEANNVTVGTMDKTYFAVKLTSQYEAQKITSLMITASGTALVNTDVTNLELFRGADTTPFATASQMSCTSNVCTYTWTSSDNLLPAAVQPGSPVTVYLKADISPENVAKLGNDFVFKIAASTDVVTKGASTGTAGSVSGTPTVTSITYISPFSVLIDGSSPTSGSSNTQTIVAGTTLGRFKLMNNGSAQVTLTNVKFTDNGSHTGTDERYTVFASSENSSDYTANSLEVSGTDSLDFADLTSTITINGGAYRYLTVTLSTAGSVATGNSFNLAVASFGDLKFSVSEANLGYDSNKDGDTSDTATGLRVNGKPSLGTIVKQ